MSTENATCQAACDQPFTPVAPIPIAQRIENLCRDIGVDPRELIPCKSRTKRPLVRGFNQPGYATNWDRLLKRPEMEDVNLALRFGQHSRLIGLDCDHPHALGIVENWRAQWTHVRTARGICLLARSNNDVANVTASTVLKLNLGSNAMGELRLQRCFSLIDGIHPTGRPYELERKVIPVLDLRTLVADLRTRGFDFPPLLPPCPAGQAAPGKMDSVQRYWAREAAMHGDTAPARPDGTVGTDAFVLAMTTRLRERPHLVETVVAAFTKAVTARGLTIRDGQGRLMDELRARRTKWAQSYGLRVVHRPLRTYYQVSPIHNTKQDTPDVFLRFLEQQGVRADQRLKVADITRAFACRARVTENRWAYEATTALDPDVDPATFSRAVARAVILGLLERAPNTLPSSLPPHLTAKWKYRVTPLALELT